MAIRGRVPRFGVGDTVHVPSVGPVTVGSMGKKLLGESKPVLEYPCWAAPVVSHGLLYLRGKDRLVCLELVSEKKNQ